MSVVVVAMCWWAGPGRNISLSCCITISPCLLVAGCPVLLFIVGCCLELINNGSASHCHTKCGFGTKLGCLQGIRARQSARYIDGMMQAQKPNCVGAIANIIWVSSDCQITNHPSVKQQLGKPWQKFHSDSDSRKQQQTALKQDESLCYSGFLHVTVFCYRLVQWMLKIN